MKKILLSAMASTVLAGGTLAGGPSCAFNGLYAGGGLTYSKSDLTLSAGNNSATFSSSGVSGNGFLGYGTVIYRGLYLGGELGLGFDGSRFKNKTSSNPLPDGSTLTLQVKSSSKLTYNMVGRVGYVFSSLLAYAKVGFEGRSKISTLGTIGSLSRNGILLGLGADYAITKNIFLRAEYTYNFGARKKFSDVEGNTYTFRTSTKTILIGAGYKF